ncbi:ABC transporter permease [Corynebacterium deserti GIMN1.010]|uniref:ABC transporter permease n=1 Tax=Corynebacterium deserti GIMN1.010 TaxID=931089 RepID=A0A0M4CCR7_9CORY|nr:ABC transporter permease [Corynebacterium deserti GIMN1.010]
MFRLAFAQLRRRGGRYFSLFFAIFASVALTVSVTALTNSLVSSVNDLFAKPYENADLVVTVSAKNEDIFEDFEQQLAATPGVEALAFDQNFAASVKQSDGIYASTSVQSISEGPLQWRPIIEGRLPQGPGEIAVTTASDVPEVGELVSIRLSQNTEDTDVMVVGVVEPAAQETLGGAPVIVASPDALAQWNSASVRGEFRVATSDAAALDNASFADATVVIDSAAGHVDKLADSYLGQRDRYFLLLAAFVVVAAAVAFLVVFSAYSVLTGERVREFGLIRSVGASTPQILGSVIFEAGLLGAVAAGLGAPTGLLAARTLADNAWRFGIRVPIEVIDLPSTTMWLIAGVGVLMSIAAALPAVFSVCRKSAVESLSSPAISRTSPWIGALWLLFGGIIGVAGVCAYRATADFRGMRAVALSIAASGALVCALLIATAVIVPWVLQVSSRVLGGAIPTLQLGLAFAAKQKSRSAALIAVILAGSALSSAVLHGQAHIGTHLVSVAKGMGGTDMMVTALDGNIPDGMLEEISSINGVNTAFAPATTVVELDDSGSLSVLMLAEEDGDSVMRAGDTGAPTGGLVLGRNAPEQDAYPVGEVSEITVAGTPAQAEIFHSDNYFSMIDPALATEPSPSTTRNLLILLDGPANQAPDNATAQSVRKAISLFNGRYSITEGFSARQNTFELVSRITTMSTLLTIVALAIAAVGLINTVALTIAERARDRYLLRTIALTSPGQILVMTIEMIALSLPAAIVGAVSGGFLGRFVASSATSSTSALSPLQEEILGGTILAMVVGSVLCALIVMAKTWRRLV